VSPPTVLVVPVSLDELVALVYNAVDAALSARAPAPSTTPLVDKRELARVLNISAATVTRMTAEGMPHIFAGASPRYEIDEVRGWLDARGRRGTLAKPSKRESLPGVRLLSRSARWAPRKTSEW
jgi:hypothetical protein